MKRINIYAIMKDDVLYLQAKDDNSTIGSMWDNNAQTLIFNRDDKLVDYNLMLFLKSNDDWEEIQLGRENKYTLTNAFTQKKSLKLQVAFWDSDGFRYSSTNALSFKYSYAPQDGSIPEEIVNEYTKKAVVDGKEVNDRYDFYNLGGDVVFSLPKSSGMFSFSKDDDGNLFVEYDDNDKPPQFEVDEDGNIYYITSNEAISIALGGDY